MTPDTNPGTRVVVTRRERILILAIVVLVIIGSIVIGSIALRAADVGNVKLNVDKAGPREVEEQTEKAVLRDYAGAWRSLATALEQNNAGALGDLWAGFARQKFVDAIAQQQQSGVAVRYIDHGHQLNAVVYSPEGSALELHDTAQLERQVLDGATVIDSENVTVHYVVVMTPTTDHWQVRLLQSVPEF
jgi:hypothetical protein